MILIFGMLCLGLLAATCWPATSLGKLMRRLLIDAPAEGVSRKGLSKLGSAAIFLLVLLIVASAPELLAIAAIADLSLFAEMMGLVVMLSAAGYLKDAASAVRRVVKAATRPLAALRHRRAARTRSPASRPAKPRKPPAEPDPGWAFA